MSWNALEPYSTYRKTHNNSSSETICCTLPFIRVMSGTVVESITGNKYDYNEDSSSIYHTEQWFYEILLSKPKVVIDQAIKDLEPTDKIVNIIFDFYSWWDICRDCQDRFRTEYFKGNVRSNWRKNLNEEVFVSQKI